MTDREYARLRAQIEQRYRDDIAALDRVREIAVKDVPQERGGRISKGAVLEAVREATAAVKQSFTLRDVEFWLRANKPALARVSRTTISGALRRLTGREVEEQEKGSGKRPTTYRRISAPAAPLRKEAVGAS
jgi:hypothetical protein